MLILAATPIGNLKDCSKRLIETLQSADHVYAEDTRHARKLLSHLQIKQKLRAFHDFSPPGVAQQIGGLLAEGKTIVYISDAGTPILNDPGFELVQVAIEKGIEVDHIPGPSAPINALVLSGLAPHEFCFLGFFPNKRAKREAILKRLPQLAMTSIFFEAPSRIRYTLAFLAENLPKTQIALCREMTKRFQETLRGTAKEVNDLLRLEKGEMVLVIDKVTESTEPVSMEVREETLRQSGLRPNQIAKILASEFKLPKREIYARLSKKNSLDDNA